MNPSLTPTWLCELLENPKITDICINGDNRVFFDQGYGMELKTLEPSLFWNEHSQKEWILEQLSRMGRTWDARFPFADATLVSGHRLHVAFPPLAQPGILISIRRLSTSSSQMESLPRWKNTPGYELLEKAVTQGESVLLAGATGSGKTTLASELLGAVPKDERLILLEDTPELAPLHPHSVRLVSRPPNADGFGEVSLRTLLKQVLRMRPDRVILGECRGAEVLELLQALNTGHRGALATLHANSSRDALKRIELLCLLHAGGTIPLTAIRELIASGIQWIAHVKRHNAQRVISEISKVEGREGDTILIRPMLN